MNRTKIAGVAVAILVVIAAVAGVVWSQSGEADVRQAGACDNASYVLEAEREDNTTEVSFEVQAGEPGQAWDVRIEQGDEVLVEGTRTTDAEIDVDAYAVEGASREFTATATQGEQACTATITAN